MNRLFAWFVRFLAAMLKASVRESHTGETSQGSGAIEPVSIVEPSVIVMARLDRNLAMLARLYNLRAPAGTIAALNTEIDRIAADVLSNRVSR